MIAPLTHLRVFLTSLLLSLAWYYYTSTYFLDFLGAALQGGAILYFGTYLYRRVRGHPRGDVSPLRSFAFWNSTVFFGLLLIAEIISCIEFQFTWTQYLWQQSFHFIAYGVILFCAWKMNPPRSLPFIQIPLILCSALLFYEIILTTQKPSPNQCLLFGPVMEGGFISYSGGKGRLINTHYHIQQRRYLTPLVPGAQAFRPTDQATQAQRIAADQGTPIWSPVTGTVLSAIDSLPDLPAGTIDDSNPPGNHLCIQISDDHYLYLANFAQGSMTVSPGDSVQIGQTLGRIGKNGSFTESALVVLLVDNPNVIDPNTRSLPFYFKEADGSLVFPKRNERMHQEQ